MAIHRVLAEDASKLASEVSGVKEVQNRIVVVHGPRAFTNCPSGITHLPALLSADIVL